MAARARARARRRRALAASRAARERQRGEVVFARNDALARSRPRPRASSGREERQADGVRAGRRRSARTRACSRAKYGAASSRGSSTPFEHKAAFRRRVGRAHRREDARSAAAAAAPPRSSPTATRTSAAPVCGGRQGARRLPRSDDDIEVAPHARILRPPSAHASASPLMRAAAGEVNGEPVRGASAWCARPSTISERAAWAREREMLHTTLAPRHRPAARRADGRAQVAAGEAPSPTRATPHRELTGGRLRPSPKMTCRAGRRRIGGDSSRGMSRTRPCDLRLGAAPRSPRVTVDRRVRLMICTARRDAFSPRCSRSAFSLGASTSAKLRDDFG